MSRVVTTAPAPLSPERRDEFDVAVANVTAATLVAVAPTLLRAMHAEGAVVVSGMLDGQQHDVGLALAPLRPTATELLDGWVAMTLRDPARRAGRRER